MQKRRETIRCVESGRPFGLSALWEGVLAVPVFTVGMILLAFVTVLPGTKLSLAAWAVSVLTLLLIVRLVISSWQNPIYRKLRWLGLVSLVAVTSGVASAVAGSSALGKPLLCLGAFLLGSLIPMYPFLRPIETENIAPNGL
ncbi:MAG TPA: hypothetical protein VG838_02410 [Opitutaceae bacterium]|nr:hypothetical protein [Opitutaceae bacterium]